MGSRAVSGLVIITVRTPAMVVVSALARESTSLLGASSEDTQTATELRGLRVPTTLSVHIPQDLLPGWTSFRKKTFSC